VPLIDLIRATAVPKALWKVSVTVLIVSVFSRRLLLNNACHPIERLEPLPQSLRYLMVAVVAEGQVSALLLNRAMEHRYGD
jgi:hypothetical protein